MKYKLLYIVRDAIIYGGKKNFLLLKNENLTTGKEKRIPIYRKSFDKKSKKPHKHEHY